MQRERLFHCEHFSVVAAARTIAVYRRRGGYAARAGLHRRRGTGRSTAAPLMPSAKATSCSCRRWSARVLFGRAVQSACWKLRCRIRYARIHERRKWGTSVKKLIVFDLDGTLAESKSSLDAEMSALLHDLLGIVKVAVISGGDWPQFEKQVLSHLPHDERLKNLSLLPTCGTKFYQYDRGLEKTLCRRFHQRMKERRSSVL